MATTLVSSKSVSREPPNPGGSEGLTVHSIQWPSHSGWRNIQPEWEGHWIECTVNPSLPPGLGGSRDTLFDETRVVAIGLKVAINDASGSSVTIRGRIYIDDVVIRTNPPVTFDFERLEVEQDFSALADVLKE